MLRIIGAIVILMGASMMFIGVTHFIDSAWGPSWLDSVANLFSVLTILLLLLMWKIGKNKADVDPV